MERSVYLLSLYLVAKVKKILIFLQERQFEVRGISSSDRNAIADELEDFLRQDSIPDAKDEFTMRCFNNSVITGHDPVT